MEDREDIHPTLAADVYARGRLSAKRYGHTVRVAGLEGRIVRMTPTAVILSTQDGETAVPTHLFVETTSTRVTPGGRL